MFNWFGYFPKKEIKVTMFDLEVIKNTIIEGDIITNLKLIPDNSVDLVFADPPYFMQTEGTLIRREGTKFSGVEDSWDKFEDYVHYDTFSNDWLKECKRVLKKDGTIWVIGAFQNIYRLGYIMQNLGFWILNDVVWSKPNPVPNFRGTRFTNANEIMLWCSQSKAAKYTFNYKTMKHLNGNKQMKSVWEIGLCTGNERIKDESGKKAHTTQKPEKLLLNVILSSSKIGDIVLDPFMGSGTTAAIAKLTGRTFIGIEREQKYIKVATERLAAVTTDLKNPIYQNAFDEKPSKVTIQMLIKKTYLSAGDIFYSKDKSKTATLTENGYLTDGIEALSIHKMAAKILNLSNHNGWMYWYFKKENDFVLIDDLRVIYRENNLEVSI